MSELNLIESDWAEKTVRLQARRARLERLAESLEYVPRMDIQPKLDRLDTMMRALERDVSELCQSSGANEETVERLYLSAAARSQSLSHELEALSFGNPTTVSAAADTLFKAFGRASDTVKTITSKVKLSSLGS